MSKEKYNLMDPESEAKTHAPGIAHLVHFCATVKCTDDEDIVTEVDIEGAARVDGEFYRRIRDLAEEIVMNLTEPLTADDVCNIERDELDYYTDNKIIEQIKKKVQMLHPEFIFDKEGCDYSFSYTIPIFRLIGKTSDPSGK